MRIREYYLINESFMYMAGFRDRNGNLCTLVKQTDGAFMVDKSPLEILEWSIRSVGFSYKGALETAKWHLSEIHMCPVLVNPILKICLFPIHSPKRDDNMWFNPDYIQRTTSYLGKTCVEFKDGTFILVDLKLASFNTRLKTAEQYLKITVEAGNNPRANRTMVMLLSGRRKSRPKIKK